MLDFWTRWMIAGWIVATFAQPSTSLSVGDELLISLPDIDGEYHSTYEYRGSYVLVDFWATWCLPCRMESSKIYRMARKFHPSAGVDRPLIVYRVSLDDQASKWRSYVRQWMRKGPVVNVRDPNGRYSSWLEQLRFKAIPFAVLLDPEGQIIRKGISISEVEYFLRKGQWRQ